jgi:hypothetical protein
MSRRSAAFSAGRVRPKTGSKDGSSSRGQHVASGAAADYDDSGSTGSGSPYDSGGSSPRTPGSDGDGCSSPKRVSVSRGALKSAGGVRVGKSVSVVLAKADNAGELD